MKSFFAILFAFSVAVPDLRTEDSPLEPSLRNEVDHAIDLAEAWLENRGATNAPPAVHDIFSTNGLSRERIAVKLLALQRADGHFLSPSNAAPTRLALDILSGL